MVTLAGLRYHVTRTSPPTNVSQAHVQHLPKCSSALLGLWVSRWVLGAVWWLVNYTLQQRNWRGPGGPRNSRHGWEADWRHWRNFNCTSGNTAISAIVIGKTLLHRFTYMRALKKRQYPETQSPRLLHSANSPIVTGYSEENGLYHYCCTNIYHCAVPVPSVNLQHAQRKSEEEKKIQETSTN